MSIQKKNKLYLFDLDGTLVDTTHLIIISLIKTIGVYSSVKINIKHLRGLFKASPYKIIGKYTGFTNINKKMKKYWEFYNDGIKDRVKIFPNVITMLNDLKKKNNGIAIVTSLPRSKAIKLIDHYLKVKFDAIVAYHDTVDHKPKPAPIYLAIEKYKKLYRINKLLAIYIGDSKNDILAGKNASIYTALATWGIEDKEISEIQKSNPVYILKDPLEILKIKI